MEECPLVAILGVSLLQAGCYVCVTKISFHNATSGAADVVATVGNFGDVAYPPIQANGTVWNIFKNCDKKSLPQGTLSGTVDVAGVTADLPNVEILNGKCYRVEVTNPTGNDIVCEVFENNVSKGSTTTPIPPLLVTSTFAFAHNTPYNCDVNALLGSLGSADLTGIISYGSQNAEFQSPDPAGAAEGNSGGNCTFNNPANTVAALPVVPLVNGARILILLNGDPELGTLNITAQPLP